MADFYLTQTGDEVQELLNTVDPTAEELASEIRERGSADTNLQEQIDNLSADAYRKPQAGIPAIDMTLGVQESLANANASIAVVGDKSYTPDAFSGLGRVNLEKNIHTIEGLEKNILTQDMFYKTVDGQRVPNTNTIFVIQYDYDLNEQEITIPEGCVLKFDGGSISNGSIIYNNTRVEGNYRIECTVIGGVSNEIAEPEMYGAIGDGETDDTVALQNVIAYNNNINLTKNYLVDKEKYKNGGYNNTMKAVIWIDHSCYIHGTGSILADNADFDTQVHTIAMVHCNNVTISGITIKDTIDTLIYKQSHAIYGYAVSNVSIENCVIKNICGDGIYIGRTNSGGENNLSENIRVVNNQISLCNRDGVTVSDNTKYFYIEDNTITDCGRSHKDSQQNTIEEGYLIDIEPNYLATLSEKIFIRNNRFANSVISNGISIGGVRELTISDNYSTSPFDVSRITNGIIFQNNTIDNRVSIGRGPKSVNEELLSYEPETGPLITVPKKGLLTTTTAFNVRTDTQIPSTQSNVNSIEVAVGYSFLIIKDGQKSLYKITQINNITQIDDKFTSQSFNVEYEDGKVLEEISDETCQVYSALEFNIGTFFDNNTISELALGSNYCPGVNSFMCKGGVLSLFKTNIAAVPYSVALDGVELTNESSSCISFPSDNINQQHPELSVFARFDFVSFNNCSFKTNDMLKFQLMTVSNLSFNECRFKDCLHSDLLRFDRVTGDILISGCCFENIKQKVIYQTLKQDISDGHYIQIINNKFSKCTYRILQQQQPTGDSATTHVNSIIANNFDTLPTFTTLSGQSLFKDNTYSLGIIAEEIGTSKNPKWVRVVGSTYYNKTSGKPIYWNGTAWVDATGSVVS